MEQETNTPLKDELEADGYYGDDEVETEELDLSFLDEDDAKKEEK